MKTIFSISERNFTTLEFAQKFADKNSLDYSLIKENQIKEFVFEKISYVGRERQEHYNERHALYAK